MHRTPPRPPALSPPDQVHLHSVSPSRAKQTALRPHRCGTKGLETRQCISQVKRAQPPTPEGKEQLQRPWSHWRGTLARRPQRSLCGCVLRGTWQRLTLSGQVLIRTAQAGTRGPKGLALPVSGRPVRPSAMPAALPKTLVCHVPPRTLWWAVPRSGRRPTQRLETARRPLGHMEPVCP